MFFQYCLSNINISFYFAIDCGQNGGLHVSYFNLAPQKHSAPKTLTGRNNDLTIPDPADILTTSDISHLESVCMN